MAEQDNVRIVRESWDAWNAHNIEDVLKMLDEKHVWETDTLPAAVVGRDGIGKRCRCISLHSRTYTSRPPTKRRAETHGCTVAEVRNGEIVRSWVYWDTGHLLRQLGVMPG
jgi:ketosteroid isomerase-like protein